jgi:hypothetical protein
MSNAATRDQRENRKCNSIWRQLDVKGDACNGGKCSIRICGQASKLSGAGQAELLASITWTNMQAYTPLLQSGTGGVAVFQRDCDEILSAVLYRTVDSAIYIHIAATHPDWQRRGLCRLLIAELLAAHPKCTAMHLESAPRMIGVWVQHFGFSSSSAASLWHMYSLFKNTTWLTKCNTWSTAERTADYDFAVSGLRLHLPKARTLRRQPAQHEAGKALEQSREQVVVVGWTCIVACCGDKACDRGSSRFKAGQTPQVCYKHLQILSDALSTSSGPPPRSTARTHPGSPAAATAAADPAAAAGNCPPSSPPSSPANP